MRSFFGRRDNLTSDDIITEIFRLICPDRILVRVMPRLKRLHILLFLVFSEFPGATICKWQGFSQLAEIRADKGCLNLLRFFEFFDHIIDVIHAFGLITLYSV